MSTDILLVRPNDQKSVYSGVFTNAACEPPFWLALIAAYVKEKGFTVSATDTEVLNQSPEETANLVAGIRPTIIGVIVTGTNLSACFAMTKGYCLMILRRFLTGRKMKLRAQVWNRNLVFRENSIILQRTKMVKTLT